MSPYGYKGSDNNDNTVSLPSYHYNGIPYTWKDGLYIKTGPSSMARVFAIPYKTSYQSMNSAEVGILKDDYICPECPLASQQISECLTNKLLVKNTPEGF